jgi:hypothetical protein
MLRRTPREGPVDVPKLGKLHPIAVKDVWAHEALQFTPWMLENEQHLAELLGIDLELQAAEHPVGGFRLDLVGRDLTNGCVLIVENQLTPTDHGHLGQLMTYAAGTEASTIVWIATEFREEHRQAIDWLNELAQGNARFFGVEVGVVAIRDSPPAPLFRLKAQPNDWHAVVSASAKATAKGGKAEFYRQFWRRFIERVHEEHPDWTNARVAGPDSWMTMKCPIPGCFYGVNFAMGGKTRAELYIDTGDGDENLELFNTLFSRKADVELVVGESVAWEELPNRRACRIAIYGDGDVVEVEKHEVFVTWMLDASARLRAAVEPVALEVGDG